MASNPSVDADRVIELIRAEAAKLQYQPADSTTPEAAVPPLNLPGIRDLPLIRELPPAEAPGTGVPAPAGLPDAAEEQAPGEVLAGVDLPPPPTVAWWRTVTAPKEQLKQLVGDAHERNKGPRWLPKFLRGLFRRQGRYNRALLDVAALLAKTNDELVKQVRELREAFQAQSEWLHGADTTIRALRAAATTNAQQVNALIEMRRDDEPWLDAVTSAASRVPAHDEQISTIHGDLQTLRAMLQPLIVQMQERLNLAAEQLHRGQAGAASTAADLREARWELMNLAEDTAALAAQLDALRHHAARTAADVETLRDTSAQHGAAIERDAPRVAETVTAVARLERRTDDWVDAVQRLEERLANDLVFVKAQLSRYAAEAGQSPTGRGRKQPAKRARAAASAPAEAADPQLDAFYLAFENEFRGARDEIQKRLAAYLPFLQAANISGKRGGIVDLGCGRGEWLELLKTSGYEQVHGVDLNTSMVEQCTARGLNVVHGDAVEHLRSLQDASIEAVTSFHLIEHLPFRVLMQFLREIQRVLSPGGLTILETPNPRNILVGASDFFRDMTHNNPVHPDSLRFALETIGMADVACYFLQDEGSRRTAIRDTEFVFSDLQSYVTVPRDYAVIARKT